MDSSPPRQRRLRSRDGFDGPDHLDKVALVLERFWNNGLTAEELLCGQPIIGLARDLKHAVGRCARTPWLRPNGH